MSHLKDRRTFYVNSASWVEPAILGLIVAVLSFVLNYHFFYIYLFLFLASIVCLSLSYRKYAILNDHSLAIYSKKKAPEIIVGYDQIESIRSEKKKINGVFRIGGKLGGIPNCIKEINCVLISLRTPLGKQYNPQDINEYEMDTEDKKIEVSENGSSIILYKPPKGGFRPFLDEISKSVNVLNAEMFEYENKYPNLGEMLIYLISLIGAVCMLYVCSKSF